jgi:hypothetical protein
MINFILCLFFVIPYPAQPDWESIDDDFSTGGALVDIDLDGDLDFITGNGNDMDEDPNRVYYNSTDTLERIASWISSDTGYNAHISIGDINFDGYPDLAVANYGDPSTPQYDKIYYNQSGTFQQTSSWQPSDLDNSFACAFGDVDGDGDLDLAVACGEEYTDSLQRAKVYLNHGGIIDTLPCWQTNILSYFYDVTWVDIDSDGNLDLALAGHHRANVIYHNLGGTLDTVPYWQSANSLGTLKIAFGDIDNDGDLDLVCANNAQTGGTSNCELYLNNGTNLEATPAWTSQTHNCYYYSCVALGDVDRDGDLDLAAGGWWESVKVFENNSGVLSETPSWQWSPSPSVNDLVCENISFGDVDNTEPMTITDEIHVVDTNTRVFYLDNRWLNSIIQVRSNSGPLSLNEYSFSYVDGWISVADIFTQTETLWVDYSYSLDLDLIVTNWHPYRGNFLFFNTYSTEVRELVKSEPYDWMGFPNPNRGQFTIPLDIDDIRIEVYDISGRLVIDQQNSRVNINAPGIYFMRIYEGGQLLTQHKVVVVQ